jgi:Predicted integral membrane protein
LGYAALIFFLSSQSRWIFELPDFFSADKIYHLLEYGVLGVLLSRLLEVYGFSSSSRKKMTWVLIISFLYGLSDEFHQWFVPGRSATLGDVLADSLGGWFGGLLFIKFKRKDFRFYSRP